MIDLNDMVIFSKVAELEGISAAARSLQIPKSKVSRRMALLENSLGTRLIERTTRAVFVTEAGKVFLQHCKRVEEEANGALESIYRLADTPRGHLRISTSLAIGQHLIAPYISEFMQRYPDIDIDLDLSNRRVDLIAEGYDLVVRVGKMQDSSLVAKKLGSAKAKLYAAPNYLNRVPKISTIGDLPSHQLISMTDSSRAYQWSLQNSHNQQENIDITPTLSVNDFGALCTIVVGGGGISLLPEYLTKEFVKAKTMRAILPTWTSPQIEYFILYPSHRGLTTKSRVFIDFMH